jgi:dienelactone hydrolase
MKNKLLNQSKRNGQTIAGRCIVMMLAVMCCATISSQAARRPQKPRTDARPSFAYKRSTLFDLKVESAKEEDGVIVRDVSYASQTPGRGRIKAYIVTPASKGFFGGVLFFHWLGEPNGDRNEFLSEAISLGKRGFVSLLIQGYFPWAVEPHDAETDRQRVIDETIEVRRALDLLLAQRHVDPKRIGYVGHDYGAIFGAILAGVEKRVKTFVFVAGMGNFGDWSLKYWSEPKKKGEETYRRGMNAVDPINYVSRAAPSSVLFQFSKTDKYISAATANAFSDAASSPKQVIWYDTDHAMNLDAVRKDRTDWLVRQLRRAN